MKRRQARFIKLMNTPLNKVSDKDLDWCIKQDKFNSIASKYFQLAEIKRRKEDVS